MSNCSFLAKAKNKFPIQHEELALPFNMWDVLMSSLTTFLKKLA